MSEYSAKTIRASRKAKAERMGSADPHTKVDSSDWTPAEPLNADIKTGARPVSRRAFKSGGKVCGAKTKANMGRAPRKSGGAAPKEYANAKINRNVKDANEERDGIKHVGGFKKGGRTKREYGGRGPGERTQHEVKRRDAVQAATDYNADPRVTEGVLRDKTRAFEKSAEQTAYKKGGRTKKMFGGPMDAREGIVDPKALYGARFSGPQGTPFKKGGKVHSDEAMDKALIKKMVKPSARTGRATGGMMDDAKKALMVKTDPHNQSKIKPSQPAPKEDTQGKKHGGRTARATGGRAKGKGKGKTNINIIISAGPKGQAQDQMMAGPPPSPATPPGMMPQAGMMPPMAGPPMPMGGAPGGAPAPMPRASGGRAGYAIGGRPVSGPRAAAPSIGQPAMGARRMPMQPVLGGPSGQPSISPPVAGAQRQPMPGQGVYAQPGIGGLNQQFQQAAAAPGLMNPVGGMPSYDMPVQGGGRLPPAISGPGMGTPSIDMPAMGVGRQMPQFGIGAPQFGAPVPMTQQEATQLLAAAQGQPNTTASQYLQQIGAVGRKSGGRVTKVAKSYKDMEAGAASGEGRLQKTDIAKRIPKKREDGVIETDKRGYPNKVIGATGGRTAHKAGGKVYRSYKDMDAGAGSGMGRLEKEEIQKRKR